MDILTIFLVFLVYFLPAMIANYRKHNNNTAILLSNLIFGWTVIGWLICLIWSSTGNIDQPLTKGNLK